MNLKPFLSWCATHGIVTSLDVKVRATDAVDGNHRYTVLKAGCDRNDDEVLNLLQCPLDACITASSTSELADRLAFEASLGESSIYAPYIDTLPDLSAFYNLPRFWPLNRFELVVSADGGFLQKELQADHHRLSSVSNVWAMACVDSRANFVSSVDNRKFSLTPVLDLINHDSKVKTSARVKYGDLFLDVATESVRQRETAQLYKFLRPPETEVCISYGDLTNMQTLLNYGFVRPDNPCNTEYLTAVACHGYS